MRHSERGWCLETVPLLFLCGCRFWAVLLDEVSLLLVPAAFLSDLLGSWELPQRRGRALWGKQHTELLPGPSRGSGRRNCCDIGVRSFLPPSRAHPWELSYLMSRAAALNSFSLSHQVKKDWRCLCKQPLKEDHCQQQVGFEGCMKTSPRSGTCSSTAPPSGRRFFNPNL